MIVEIIRSWKNGSDNWQPGECFTVSDKDGESLIAKGVAKMYIEYTRSKSPHEGLFSRESPRLTAKQLFGGEEYTGGQSSGFGNFAEFCSAVKGGSDPRLHCKDLSGSSGPDGGFTVPVEFRTELISEILEHASLLDRLTNLPMQGNSLDIPCIYDVNRQAAGLHGVKPARGIKEGAALSDIGPEFRKVSLHLNKVGGYAAVSNELLEDSPLALSMILPRLFSEAISFDLVDQIFNGSGAGQMLGILNAPACIEVAKEDAQPDATLDFQNILKMWSRLAPAARRNAVWACSSSVEVQLRSLSLPVGTGGSAVFVTDFSQAMGSTIFGKPLLIVEQLPALGSAGDIVCFNPRSFAFGMKTAGAIRLEVSEHVRHLNDQVVFRAICRCDGQPMQSVPYVPANGGDSLSHIVKLGARE